MAAWIISLLTLAAAVVAQQAPAAAPDPAAMTQFGLPFADFVQVNQAMTQTALEDPAIVELTKQIEALTARRQEMVMEAVCQKHPELAEKVRTMKASMDELKRKAQEQAEQVRALQNSSSSVTLPPKN